MTPMKLVVVGAGGRMGGALICAIAERGDVVLHAAVERRGADGIGRDCGERAGTGANGIEDVLTQASTIDRLIAFQRDVGWRSQASSGSLRSHFTQGRLRLFIAEASPTIR